jgi:D-inositol-3-phosphate glycosyltransferase
VKTGHLTLVTLHADPATPAGGAAAGGTHAYVRELMLGLTKNRWSLTVLTRWADPCLPEREVLSPTLKIVRLRIGDVAPMDKRFLDDLHLISLAAACAVVAEEPQVDVLHSVYWNSGRVAMDLAASLSLPFVHTVISNGWRRWREGARDQPPGRIEVESRVFAAAFAIFCVSGQERADLVEQYAVNPGKLVVVGRPVAPSFRHPCHDEWGRPSPPSWSDLAS